VSFKAHRTPRSGIYRLLIVACLTLGLAPFTPEPRSTATHMERTRQILPGAGMIPRTGRCIAATSSSAPPRPCWRTSRCQARCPRSTASTRSWPQN